MSWELEHATVACDNDDCGYIGDLMNFTEEVLEDEYYAEEVREIELKCPRCGHCWTATIEPVLEYRVD